MTDSLYLQGSLSSREQTCGNNTIWYWLYFGQNVLGFIYSDCENIVDINIIYSSGNIVLDMDYHITNGFLRRISPSEESLDLLHLIQNLSHPFCDVLYSLFLFKCLLNFIFLLLSSSFILLPIYIPYTLEEVGQKEWNIYWVFCWVSPSLDTVHPIISHI